jgi:hypothetical protein
MWWSSHESSPCTNTFSHTVSKHRIEPLPKGVTIPESIVALPGKAGAV